MYHLPALPLDLLDGQRGNCEVVGQGLQVLASLVTETVHAPQRVSIRFGRCERGQIDGLIVSARPDPIRGIYFTPPNVTPALA
jgi:hypothetical protein